MRRSRIMWLIAGACGVVAAATEAPGAPVPRPSNAQLQLAKPVTIERVIDHTDLQDVLKCLGERCSVNVTVDQDAFRRAGLVPADKVSVRIPKLPGVPLDFVLELAARQAGGTVRAQGDQIVIVPGKPRDLATILRAPNEALAKKLATTATIEKAVDNAPVRDVVEFLSDKYELSILVDNWAFARPRNGDVGNDPCRLAADSKPLGKWLEDVAKQIHGKVVVRDGIILIQPQTKP